MKEILLKYGLFDDSMWKLESGEVADTDMVDPKKGKMIHLDITEHPLRDNQDKGSTTESKWIDMMILQGESHPTWRSHYITGCYGVNGSGEVIYNVFILYI